MTTHRKSIGRHHLLTKLSRLNHKNKKGCHYFLFPLQAYTVKAGSRANITVAAAFSAAGNFMPPFIIYPGLNLTGIDPAGFPGAYNWCSKSGWIDGEGFLQFIKAFDQFITKENVKKPVVLWMDNHSSHRSIPALTLAKEQGIHIMALLPNATHLIQPADIGFFNPLKSRFGEELRNTVRQRFGEPLTKRDFSSLLRKAWEQTAKVDLAVNAFRRTGIHPFLFENVDKKRIKSFMANDGK